VGNWVYEICVSERQTGDFVGFAVNTLLVKGITKGIERRNNKPQKKISG
jgi:hypothetical protein